MVSNTGIEGPLFHSINNISDLSTIVISSSMEIREARSLFNSTAENLNFWLINNGLRRTLLARFRTNGRVSFGWVFRPGVPWVLAPHVFSDIRVGGRPEPR